MPSQKLTFENRHAQTLTARLDLPVGGDTTGFALFAHCFTCSKDLRAVRVIADALNLQGLGVLRFDFTGLGESEGDFADTTFSSNVEDLHDAAAFLARDYAPARLLIGHSLGGAAVLQAAAELPEVQAIATIGAPADPAHVSHLLQDSAAEIRERGEACVRIAGREFTVRKAFLDALDGSHMREIIASLKRPLLILHSPIDDTVGVDNAADIFRAARHPKSFISLDAADHLLTRPADARFAGSMIATWADKYLALDHTPSWRESIRDNRVVVRTEDSLRTEAMANGFPLVLDEPVEVGGQNSGPTPYDALATALGACTSMTLRLYADRKRWPLEVVTVEVDHAKVHAEDCVDSGDDGAGEGSGGRLDRFERKIRLEGELDDEQRRRLLEIAERCPVHRTLEGEVRIETELF